MSITRRVTGAMYITMKMQVKIDEKLQNQLANTISDLVRLRKFGNTEPINSPRILKIRQNIQLMTMQLIGETLTQQQLHEYAQEYASQYVSASIEVGEASGEIAAQSLLQPITQATLKSQHRTGAKDSGGGASLLQLNKLNVTNRVYKIHMKIPQGKLKPPETHRQLSQSYEEVFLEDVLASTYGDSRYKPVVVEEYYSQQTEYVYLNHRDIWPSEVVHRFKMDPEKLEDAGLTQLDIVNLLLEQTDLTIIIHPLTTFIFDICPIDGQRNTSFSRKITSLLKKPLKGLKGLQMVGERNVKVSEAAPHVIYNETTNETTIYFDLNVMINFPINEFRKRIEPPNSQEIENTFDISTTNKLAYLRYKGKVHLNQTPYTYFLFIGTLSIDDILSVMSFFINTNYLISNDAHEMIKYVGITGARIAHEFAYSEALTSAGTPLLYQNITSICRRIFGIRLMPITPSGYLKGSGITPLEKLGFQNYRTVLENEMIKGTRGSTDNLPGAIMVGRKPKLGTAAMRTEPIQEQILQVVELYSIARQEQKYYNKHKGIQFPPFGTLKPLTILTNGPPSTNIKLKGI
jgi:RNA polymerase Rpb1, domain 5